MDRSGDVIIGLTPSFSLCLFFSVCAYVRKSGGGVGGGGRQKRHFCCPPRNCHRTHKLQEAVRIIRLISGRFAMKLTTLTWQQQTSHTVCPCLPVAACMYDGRVAVCMMMTWSQLRQHHLLDLSDFDNDDLGTMSLPSGHTGCVH